MSNMSYCRFYNTALDLEDCVYAIKEGEYKDEISKMEVRALENIVALAHEIIEDLKYDIEQIIDNHYESTHAK